MPQNVQRGMARDDERIFRRQITRLLANPRIGPVGAAAIAHNLGVDVGRIVTALDALIHAGQLVRAAPDAYTAPPAVDGEPLRPHTYLAPAATPLYVPDNLRGDWLLVGNTENADDTESRGGGGEGEQRSTTEGTEGTEGRVEDRRRGEAERATAEDAEGAGRGAVGASGGCPADSEAEDAAATSAADGGRRA